MENLGIDPFVANYIMLPVLVFMARIIDVSIGTIRVIFIMQGNKKLAPFLGFFESFIWLVAISQIIQNVDNMVSYIAFAGGFAAGTYVGIRIEEKLALGNVLVRIITRKSAAELITYLKDNEIQFTNVPAQGQLGPVNVLFTVIKRQKLNDTLVAIKKYNPKAFYTIEQIRGVSDMFMTYGKDRHTVLNVLNLKKR
ncbi:DUF2179 domain-containing protein [Bacteroidota bacterium]